MYCIFLRKVIILIQLLEFKLNHLNSYNQVWREYINFSPKTRSAQVRDV